MRCLDAVTAVGKGGFEDLAVAVITDEIINIVCDNENKKE